MKERASSIKRYIDHRVRIVRQRVFVFVDRRPLLSFFVLLGLILLLIGVSNYLNRQKPAPVIKEIESRQVDTYRIGSAPKVTLQAQTRKSGVIQIVALTSGVIDRIYHLEGEIVNRGTLLVGMSTNYQGGNALSLQRQLAKTQYDNVTTTYPTQKEIIQKQKELAQKTDENSDQLRDITSKSISETQGLINLNQEIISSLDQSITTLQQTPGNEALILSTKQLKSQFLAALNSAQNAIRTAQFQAAGDKPPAQMSDLQKDIAIKQLEVQEKQLDLNKEVSRLQFQIAAVNEGLMFPTSPFRATIQRVYIKEKTAVTPGTPLMIISQLDDDPITAVALAPKDIAQRVSVLEPSILHIGNKTYEVNPSFVSTEAVEGTLYAIYYPIPDTLNKDVVNDGYITVDVPIGYFDTSAIISFIPLDAVYQTREAAYVFVIENGKARAREIVLGSVYGRFVEVQSGLMNGDEIILDRTVIENDPVYTQP